MSRSTVSKADFTPVFLRRSEVRLKGSGNILNVYLCKCGVEFLANNSQIAHRKVVSCGCYIKQVFAARQKHLDDPSASSFNAVYGRYKQKAAKKGQEFTFTPIEFKELTQKDCFYCGNPPSTRYFNPSAKAPYIYNGLDRVDSTLGYTSENAVTCCATCNYMKSDLTLRQFLIHIQKIRDHLLPIDSPIVSMLLSMNELPSTAISNGLSSQSPAAGASVRSLLRRKPSQC